MKQKQAVYEAIESTLGTIEAPVTLTKDQRKTIIAAIAQNIFDGNVEFSDEAKAKYDSLEKIAGYCGGLLNNWLRKDTRLNGGTTYTPSKPGSRAGQGDEVLKNLKALRQTRTDATEIAEIDLAITARIAEVAAAKTAKKSKSQEVDMSAVPDDLKEMLGIAV